MLADLIGLIIRSCTIKKAIIIAARLITIANIPTISDILYVACNSLFACLEAFVEDSIRLSIEEYIFVE